MGALSSYYRGRRVLVTGHTGFKGSWLTLWLHVLGARVAGFALPPDTTPNLFELAAVAQVCDHNLVDVRDARAVLELFERCEPEVVFHLAAQPIVRRSYAKPKETFDVNAGGTVTVLEAIRQTASVRAAVIVTTDKVYENREWMYGYREVDRLGGRDPYSASKAAAEMAVASYRLSFFGAGGLGPRAGIASARAGNVVGGGDWAEDRIIPDAVRAVERGDELDVRNPNAVRPWQHVLEPLAGYLALALRLHRSPGAHDGPFNFGPASHDVVTVGALLETFHAALGRGRWRDASASHDCDPHEAGLLRLACDRAHTLLEWQPVLDTTEAVTMTAAWYRDVAFGSCSARQRCEQDLATYTHAARELGVWWAT